MEKKTDFPQIELINEDSVMEFGGEDTGLSKNDTICGNLRHCGWNSDRCPRMESCSWN